MEKLLDLLNRFSVIYHIPKWAVDSAAIAIFCILILSPFVAYYLMRPKYHNYREMFLFKVLWRWKYKKGDVISLWCYCPKCGGMLICDDENCRTTTQLQEKITFFVCNECGGDELGRVVGGDRRYALSLVRRDIWRHIKEGSYNDVSTATKEAIELYQQLEEEKKQEQAALAAQLEAVAPEQSVAEENVGESTTTDEVSSQQQEASTSDDASAVVSEEAVAVVDDAIASSIEDENASKSVMEVESSAEETLPAEDEKEESPVSVESGEDVAKEETPKPLEEPSVSEETVIQHEDVKKDGI